MSSCDEVRGLPRVSDALMTPGFGRLVLPPLLAALGRAIAQNTAEDDLVSIFEREVQHVLAMRAVRLREIPARYQVRLVTPTRTADSLVLGVPSSDPRVQAVLEATCDADRALDESDYQVLGWVAQLAGLVLEAARSRRALRPRHGDEAAPLIGSTPAMSTSPSFST